MAKCLITFATVEAHVPASRDASDALTVRLDKGLMSYFAQCREMFARNNFIDPGVSCIWFDDKTETTVWFQSKGTADVKGLLLPGELAHLAEHRWVVAEVPISQVPEQRRVKTHASFFIVDERGITWRAVEVDKGTEVTTIPVPLASICGALERLGGSA